MSSQVTGIGEYIKRLEKIAEECGEKPQKEAVQKDEFLRIKRRCYEVLEETRDSIRERQVLIKKRGNCYESIQRGNDIRLKLDELKKTLPRMQELHKKAQGRWNASRRQEELQERYQAIRLLKRMVDEANDMFVSGNAAHTTDAETGMGQGPHASLLGLRHSAADEDKTRMISEDEKGVMDKIKARDLEVDKQVGEIGNVVDRLGDMALHIGTVAERQRLKADALSGDVDKADEDMKALNKKVAELIQYEKNSNFCCQMILIIGLLCCVGFIIQQMA